MTPSFILFYVEGVNELQDAACHLILIPVIDGVKQEIREYFFNPEAPFLLVKSGITEKEVLTFPKFSEQWAEVQSILDKFDIAVCAAEGYSAHTLCSTLKRLNVPLAPMEYCNAKAICRRSLNEVSYSLDYLSYVKFNDTIPETEPPAIANRWCDLALMGLADRPEVSLRDFLKQAKISLGVLSTTELKPSLCLKDYSKRKGHKFDPSAVAVDANPENPLFGMNVVFTGKLETLTRNEARSLVVKVGGNAPENLNKDTDYLVVGVQDLRVVGEKGLSSKMKSASKYKEKGCPIEVIDERDFLDMIGNGYIPTPAPVKKRVLPFITEEDISHLSDQQVQKAPDILEQFREKNGLN